VNAMDWLLANKKSRCLAAAAGVRGRNAIGRRYPVGKAI
jgi:hypothetical protein